MRVEINLPSQPGQQPSIVFDDQAQHLTSGIAASHDQHDCSSHSSDQLASMHISPPQSAAGAHASLYPVDPRLQIGGKPWAKPPAKPIAFVNANVVDPESGKLFTKMTLKVKGGKIDSLEKTRLQDEYDLAQSSEWKMIDASKYYLTPGLIDCHVHITATPGAPTMAATLAANRDVNVLRSTYVLKGMLSHGYTTVRDVGGASKAHADAVAEGLIPGPRLFQGGPVVSQTGGHGDSRGQDVPASAMGCCGGGSGTGSLSVLVDGVDQCLKTTRELMRQGADHIKICTSGGVGSLADRLEAVQFTVDELKAITTTVSQMGPPHALVTAHCYTNEGILHAMEGGVRGIEHGNLLSESTAKRMAEKGMFLTPTLAVHSIISRPPFSNFLEPSQLEKNEIVRTAGLKAIQHAEKAGVTVCLGSDMIGAMNPLLQTNEFVVRASVLPSPVVLKQATCNPARMLGMEGQIGTLIKPGAFADILIMTHNPLEDVTIFDRYEETQVAVLKEGRVMKSKVKELVAEVSLE